METKEGKKTPTIGGLSGGGLPKTSESIEAGESQGGAPKLHPESIAPTGKTNPLHLKKTATARVETKAETGDKAPRPETRPPSGYPQDAGAFIIKTYESDPGAFGNREEFNIEPRDTAAPIPEDQREIELGIYETWGVLKLLRDQDVFKKKAGTQSFAEFRRRLLEVARIGLAANHVKTRLAAKALEQIRHEITIRKGVAIKLRYLVRLAAWAVLGILAGAILISLSGPEGAAASSRAVTVFGLDLYLKPLFVPGLSAGYGWVIVGAMVGAWLSVAATRRRVTFEEMPNLLSSFYEPFVRVLFVALLAVTLALLLEMEVLTIQISTVDFSSFGDQIGIALILGLIAGIGEKAISLRIIERTGRILSPGTA